MKFEPGKGYEKVVVDSKMLLEMSGDGDLDMVVGNGYSRNLVYLKNTGNKTNPVYTQQNGADNPFDTVDVGFNAAPTSLDMDNDGDPV